MKLFLPRYTTVLFIALGLTNLASAADRMPSAAEIVRAAKAEKFNRGASTTATKGKTKLTVTPIQAAAVTVKDLEKGRVIARVTTTGVRGLTDGDHNLFVIKSANRWQAFFESGQRVVAGGKDFEVAQSSSERKVRPVIDLLGAAPYCLTFCVGSGLNTACAIKICHSTD